MRRTVAWLWLFLVPTLSAPLGAQEKARDIEPRLVKLVAECTPKTVCVRAALVGRYAILGSGSIISRDGYVLTCAHVVDGVVLVDGSGLNVLLPDGRDFPAKLLGKHSRRDFAVLKIEAKDLPCYDLGDSDGLKEGQWLLALGHPMGIAGLKATGNEVPAVCAGVVLGLGKKLVLPLGGGSVAVYPDGILTDLPIYFGSSGGPLVNLEGKLVGVNAAGTLTSRPRGLSIPVKTVKAYLQTLEAGKDARDAETDTIDPNLLGRDPETGKRQPEPEGVGDALEELLRRLQGEGNEPLVDPRLDRYREEFTGVARGVLPSIVMVRLGEELVSFGVVVDGKGTIATPHHALTRKGMVSFLCGKLEDNLPNDPRIRGLVDRFLPRPKKEGVRVETAAGARYAAKERKTVEAIDMTFLDVEYGTDKPPEPLVAQEPMPERGSWVVAVTGEFAPEGVGILSTRGNRIEQVAPVVLSMKELSELVKEDMSILQPRTFPHILFHDAFVSNHRVGGPLLDAKGRWIGVNVFSMVRGASYAVPAKDVLEALK